MLAWSLLSGRSPGGEHGNPLQYSCLENPRDRGDWRATVHGVSRVRQDWSDLACKDAIERQGFTNVNVATLLTSKRTISYLTRLWQYVFALICLCYIWSEMCSTVFWSIFSKKTLNHVAIKNKSKKLSNTVRKQRYLL